MKNLKIFLIIFLALILLGGGFLFVYKDNLAGIMQEKVSLNDEFLLVSGSNSNKVKDKELETELMNLSKYKKLEIKTPVEFIEKEIKIGKSTSSSNYVKQLIFFKSKQP